MGGSYNGNFKLLQEVFLSYQFVSLFHGKGREGGKRLVGEGGEREEWRGGKEGEEGRGGRRCLCVLLGDHNRNMYLPLIFY